MIEALVTITLIVVLVARELIALDHSERSRRRARILGVIAVPLFVGFFVISVQRLLLSQPPSATAQTTPQATPELQD